MKTVSREEWIPAIHAGDFGVCLGEKSFFSKLQNLFRKKEHEGDKLASHGIYCTGGYGIIEAEYPYVTDKNKITRYLDDHHDVWIWRYADLTDTQLEIMNAVAKTEVAQKEPYGVGDIIKKGLHYLFGTALSDSSGTFCTELLWRLAAAASLTFVDVTANQCDPSLLRCWFEEKQRGYWELVASRVDGVYSLKS